MQIIYIIGGVSAEYEGWLKVGTANSSLLPSLLNNGDQLRRITKKYVNQYMLPAGQKYILYWTGINKGLTNDVYINLEQHNIPRYANSTWFNTDVWTIRKALSNKSRVYNCRQLKPMDFAKYLNRKYRLELQNMLKHPHNLKEQRFKCNFYSEWQLSSLTPKAIQRVIQMFSAFLLLRNLISTVPKGCRKIYRKLMPLRIDDLDYDLKLLDHKFRLNRILDLKNQINSLKGKPFGTAEFTNQYLVRNVPYLQIFNSRLLKTDFNL